MKNDKPKFQQARFLIVALVFSAFAFVPLLTARMQSQQNETNRRERVITKQTASPQQTASPKRSPSPKLTPTPPVPATPAPQATPTPALRVQTLVELQQQIRSVLLRSELARARVGVKVAALDSGKTIFEDGADKYFMPASNMKSFTVAAALDRLTPDFRFVTSVYAAQKPDAGGTIRGDLIVYGRGDPSFSLAFSDAGTPLGIGVLADKIAASGVKRIEGNLVGDESYFSGDPIGASWEWDDLQWYYGAEISALSVNDNAVEITLFPSQIEQQAVLRVSPANSVVSFVNQTKTTAAGTKREIEITKRLGANLVEMRGNVPLGDKGWTGSLAVNKPAELFVDLLNQALKERGIVITGKTRTVDAKAKAAPIASPPPNVEIARLESPPLSLIAAKTLKPSQNLYTELILRALGEMAGDKTDSKKMSAERGIEAAQKFFIEAGIAPGSVVQWDGSGLSRHNLITPNAVVQLYSYMSRHRHAAAWREALTVAGVDGTLSNRFKNTVAAGNVRGKTGTISQVSTLAGYVTTAAGERLAFAVLVNNLPGSSAAQRAVIDEIVLALAQFNGKTAQN